MDTPTELRARAARYRAMERDVDDRLLRDALIALAAEYEALAVKLESETHRNDGDQV